jgi:hypothetical protein
MRFAQVNDLPIILARHGVDVTLAQEANIVRVLELADGRRVASELFVIELDRPLVLQAAMDELILLVALNIRGDARGSDGQRDQNQHRHEDDREQDVT